MLLLTEDDVRRLLTMDMAIAAVEAGLREQNHDEAENIARARCRTDRVMLHLLGGASRGTRAIGYKAYTTGPDGARFHVGLFDGQTGAALALIQADYLGQMRTGAASGVASKLMARDDAERVGLFGTGKQARTQAWAICRILPVRRIHVYGRNEERRKAFAHELEELCACEAVAVNHPEEAVREMDVVITATTSKTPVLSSTWLGQGTHLNVIGSNYLQKAEVDVGTFRRAKHIVVDSKEQARLEAGDFVQALEEGVLHWSGIHELHQIVAGRYPGRSHPEDVTVFKSLGLGLEDVVVAARVYAAALEAGAGRQFEF